MEENTSNENRKKSGLLWILIALLAITNGVTFWMYWQEKNKAANEIVVKEQVIVERDNVKSDLLQLQKDFDNLQTNDKALQAEIEAKKAAIRAEDIAKGVFVPVSSLPQREPMKGVQTA